MTYTMKKSKVEERRPRVSSRISPTTEQQYDYIIRNASILSKEEKIVIGKIIYVETGDFTNIIEKNNSCVIHLENLPLILVEKIYNQMCVYIRKL